MWLAQVKQPSSTPTGLPSDGGHPLAVKNSANEINIGLQLRCGDDGIGIPISVREKYVGCQLAIGTPT